jgi:ubiquitin-activating enzyme E1
MGLILNDSQRRILYWLASNPLQSMILNLSLSKTLALRSVDLYAHLKIDPTTCPQFFLRREDIGKARGEATVGRLAELNAYVPVRNLAGRSGQEISVDLIKGFQVNSIQI